jgi:anti-anti-sigma factor
MEDARRRPHPPQLEVQVLTDGGRCTLRLAGELDFASRRSLEEALLGAEKLGPERITVDVERLSFIDSAGIEALVVAKRRADADSRELAVCKPTGQVRRVFDLIGLDKLLSLVED